MGDPVRLNKYLSQAGIASRRAADKLISGGSVRVNGRVVDTLGVTVDPESDRVEVDGKPVNLAPIPTTVLLHKPASVLTTMEDPEGRRTVRDVLDLGHRLHPIGRLDYHTEGVLLLTSDGALTHKLLHPRFKVPKTYVVKVGGRPTDAVLRQLESGVRLDDGRTQPAVVNVLDQEERRTWLEMIITEGRNRQVRRMCEAVGHRPLRLVRTAFATLSFEGLRPGEYRYLDASELHTLYSLVGLTSPGQSAEALRSDRKALGTAERGKGALPGATQAGEIRTRRLPAKKDLAKQRKKPSRAPRAAAPKAEPSAKPLKPKGIHPSDYKKRASSGPSTITG